MASVMITMMDYFGNIRTTSYKSIQAQIDAGLGDSEMIVFHSYNRTQCNVTTGVCIDKTVELYKFNPVGPSGENYTVTDIGGEGQYEVTFSAAGDGKVEFDLLLCNRTCCQDPTCEFLKRCKADHNCRDVSCTDANGYTVFPCLPAMATNYERAPFAPQVVLAYSGTRAKDRKSVV